MRFAADFGWKFSKRFRDRKILRSKSREIVRKSVLPDDVQPRHDPQRSPKTVPSVGMLRRVRLRAIFDRKFRKIFAAAKFLTFGPIRKSCANALKSVLLDDARPCREANRSAMSLATIGMPRRAGLHAFFAAIRTANFEKFSRPQNFRSRNRVRSRRNPRCPTTPGLAARQTGPQCLWRASAYRGVWDCA